MWCVIIPTYNNAGTIREVITNVRQYTRDIIVVNDGCTDDTLSVLDGMDVTVASHARNRGKGQALKTGFEKAREAGFDCAITMDADGQHLASDIPAFVQAARQHPGSLVVGCRNLSAKNMPSANTFANKFSNFWFRLQTGIDLPDTQTGFRLYPLKRIGKKMWWMTSRYEAELELLIYAAWHGIRLIPVKTHVYYPPAQERVTHFRPVYDFARISLLNVVVCILAVIIGLPLRLIRLSCPDRS